MNEAAAERVRQVEADLRAAVEWAASFQYDEAVATLAKIAAFDHPRLVEQAAAAKRLLAEVTEERHRRRDATDEARRQAWACLAHFDYDGAARWIESVPSPLRDGDLRGLAETVAQRQREVDALTEELREAVRQKRLIEVPSRVQRVLAVQPDHPYATNVAEQARKALLSAAKKATAEHRYDQALLFLDQISELANPADFARTRGLVSEMAWLAWDLRNAPVVDDTLAAVARRLNRLSPNDPLAARACEELQRRATAADKLGRRGPVRWAGAPEKTPLGPPVDWLTGFRRLRRSESVEGSELSRQPGLFAVACGLALAGLGQAALPINLLSAPRQGFFQRVAGWVRPQGEPTAWGIDVGAGGVKAVRLAWDEASRQAVIEHSALVEHAKPLSQAVNDAEAASLVADSLKALAGRVAIGDARVCAGLPGRMTLGHQFRVPPVDASRLAKVIEFEAARHFPIPLEQLAWDHRLFDDPAADRASETTAAEKKEGRRALLLAAKLSTTQPFLDSFQRAGLRVDLLQTDYVALHNFLVHDRLSSSDALSSPSSAADGGTADKNASDTPCRVVAALDVGCDVTNLLISSRDSFWHRGCGVAGRNVTLALASRFQLGMAQAELWKRSPQTADRFGQFNEAIGPVIDDLMKDLRTALSVHDETRPDRSIDQILGLGGGFSLHGLLRRLRCGR